ncbi:hypothetical protein A2U01_0014423 [Trifolium medium]|uniref:Uncharacterized protein n=1 Tax=Trifolium medium TaxID=97028 RepID=A0A392N1M1_9FABA|nr:hypothetical protein [Trifolium medium]
MGFILRQALDKKPKQWGGDKREDTHLHLSSSGSASSDGVSAGRRSEDSFQKRGKNSCTLFNPLGWLLGPFRGAEASVQWLSLMGARFKKRSLLSTKRCPGRLPGHRALPQHPQITAQMVSYEVSIGLILIVRLVSAKPREAEAANRFYRVPQL